MSTAPWNANEKWEFWTDAKGKKFAKVTGRTLAPAKLKADPLWWFRNDYEQQIGEAPWFMPGFPEWMREAAWSVRNPMENGNMFAWGVADRNYTVDVIEGDPDPMVIQRDDVIGPDGKPEKGYQRSRLTFEDGKVKYWTSYCDDHVVHSYGWQPSGLFEIKFHPKG